MLFTGIILQTAKNIQQERSVASIHYLLIGAKSVQTQQDAQIYGNQSFYGIYKELKRSDFDKRINELIHKNLLKVTMDGKERLVTSCTKEGEKWLTHHQAELPFHHYQGMNYEAKAPLFYNRLFLLIQTLSNIKENNFSFIPVIADRDAEEFVRIIYRKIRGNELSYIQAFHAELEHALNRLTNEEASIFVERLSGYRHYGKSIAQLSAAYKKSSHDIRLIHTGILHQLLHWIEQENTKFPILTKLVEDLDRPLNLTASTQKTYDLFKQGHSAEEIAKRRRLKMNTIYDHLTEIALHDSNFPFQKFVPQSIKNEILDVIKKTNTYKLKAIKEQVSSNISFFQIRLMLVYHHRQKGVDSIV